MSTSEVLLRTCAILLLLPIAAYRAGYHLGWSQQAKRTATLVVPGVALAFTSWSLVANL